MSEIKPNCPIIGTPVLIQCKEQEYHGLDTKDQVFFYEQEFYVLSNFSAFSIIWKEMKFDTAEHLYHYCKFTNHPNIQEMIRTAPSAHEAFQIAQTYKRNRVENWDDIKLTTMCQILVMKVKQHPYVAKKLIETGNRELIENSWRDDYWGWGPNRNGENALGKLWMSVRESMR